MLDYTQVASRIRCESELNDEDLLVLYKSIYYSRRPYRVCLADTPADSAWGEDQDVSDGYDAIIDGSGVVCSDNHPVAFSIMGSLHHAHFFSSAGRCERFVSVELQPLTMQCRTLVTELLGAFRHPLSHPGM